jgi:hypothetical protein
MSVYRNSYKNSREIWHSLEIVSTHTSFRFPLRAPLMQWRQRLSNIGGGGALGPWRAGESINSDVLGANVDVSPDPHSQNIGGR